MREREVTEIVIKWHWLISFVIGSHKIFRYLLLSFLFPAGLIITFQFERSIGISLVLSIHSLVDIKSREI